MDVSSNWGVAKNNDLWGAGGEGVIRDIPGIAIKESQRRFVTVSDRKLNIVLPAGEKAAGPKKKKRSIEIRLSKKAAS